MTEPQFETAVFVYDEDGPGRYVIMATKLVRVNEDLRRCGFTRGHCMFVNMETFEAHYGPREFSNSITAYDDDGLKKVLEDFVSGSRDTGEFNNRVFGPEGLIL